MISYDSTKVKFEIVEPPCRGLGLTNRVDFETAAVEEMHCRLHGAVLHAKESPDADGHRALRCFAIGTSATVGCHFALTL